MPYCNFEFSDYAHNFVPRYSISMSQVHSEPTMYLFVTVVLCAHYMCCCRTLTSGVEYLEKRGDYGEAVELLQQLLGQSQYGRSLRGHWLERLSLNLDFHLRERDKVGLNDTGHPHGSN